MRGNDLWIFPIHRHLERLLCHGRSHHTCSLLWCFFIYFIFFVTCHYNKSHVNQSESPSLTCWMPPNEKHSRHKWQKCDQRLCHPPLVIILSIPVASLLSSLDCHRLSFVTIILIILIVDSLDLILILIPSSSPSSSSTPSVTYFPSSSSSLQSFSSSSHLVVRGSLQSCYLPGWQVNVKTPHRLQWICLFFFLSFFKIQADKPPWLVSILSTRLPSTALNLSSFSHINIYYFILKEHLPCFNQFTHYIFPGSK